MSPSANGNALPFDELSLDEARREPHRRARRKPGQPPSPTSWLSTLEEAAKIHGLPVTLVRKVTETVLAITRAKTLVHRRAVIPKTVAFQVRTQKPRLITAPPGKHGLISLPGRMVVKARVLKWGRI